MSTKSIIFVFGVMFLAFLVGGGNAVITISSLTVNVNI